MDDGTLLKRVKGVKNNVTDDEYSGTQKLFHFAQKPLNIGELHATISTFQVYVLYIDFGP